MQAEGRRFDACHLHQFLKLDVMPESSGAGDKPTQYSVASGGWHQIWSSLGEPALRATGQWSESALLPPVTVALDDEHDGRAHGSLVVGR